MTSRLHRAALAYAKLGFAVFPLVDGGKKPRIPQSNPDARDGGLHLATKDAEQIDRWWSQWPSANIGIATGAVSGIYVLDVDVSPRDGEVSLSALIAEHGELPETPTQITGVHDGRRGRQYVFQHVEGLRNTAGRLGPGLDTRGDGGYIVAAPSLHPSGVVYEWLVKPSAVSPAPLPDWLVTLLRPKISERAAVVERPRFDDVPEAFVRKALDGEYDRVAKAGPGTRNQALNTAAFNLGQLVGANVLPQSQAEAALRAGADANGYLAEEGGAHVESVIRSGLAAGIAKPREIERRASKPRSAPARATPQLRVVSQEEPEPTPRAEEEHWRDGLVLNTEGGIKRQSLANAITILRSHPETAGLFVRDDFQCIVATTRRPPWAVNGYVPGRLTDADIVGAAAWLEKVGVSVSVQSARHAIEYIAGERHVHPVRDYFRSLTWDGIERLDMWLADFLGAADTAFTRAAGAKWMIGAVARIMQPGAKVDTMLILEGPQGIKKSSALAVLAQMNGASYFTDEVAALGSKDAAMQLQGNVIVEMAELDALGRADVKSIKAFLTRQTDKVRLPYAQTVSHLPRQCVFAGTLNPDGTGWQKDTTGGRRFWPIPCTTIDLQGLSLARDQLWAEAVARHAEGEPHWLTDDVVLAEAAAAQADREETDPLLPLVTEYLSDKTRCTTTDIILKAWEFPRAQANRAAEMRAANCLRKAGWQKKKARVGGRLTWVYYDPAALHEWSAQDD